MERVLCCQDERFEIPQPAITSVKVEENDVLDFIIPAATTLFNPDLSPEITAPLALAKLWPECSGQVRNDERHSSLSCS